MDDGIPCVRVVLVPARHDRRPGPSIRAHLEEFRYRHHPPPVTVPWPFKSCAACFKSAGNCAGVCNVARSAFVTGSKGGTAGQPRMKGTNADQSPTARVSGPYRSQNARWASGPAKAGT